MLHLPFLMVLVKISELMGSSSTSIRVVPSGDIPVVFIKRPVPSAEVIFFGVVHRLSASVEIKTSKPLFFDSYKKNNLTGSLIFIDEGTNETVAAGMII